MMATREVMLNAWPAGTGSGLQVGSYFFDVDADVAIEPFADQCFRQLVFGGWLRGRPR